MRKRDQEKRRRVLIAVVAVAVLIVIILIVGFVQVYVLQPASPVAKVNGVTVTTEEYQKAYLLQSYQLNRNLQDLQQQQALYEGDEQRQFMYDYLQQTISQLQARRVTLPQDVLNDLIDSELIRQEAARRGITVTEEEVQAEVERQFGYDANPPTPTPTATLTATQVITITPTPTLAPMTKEQFDLAYNQSFQQLKQAANFTEEDFRRMFRESLLRKKLEESLQEEVPTVAEQIRARHILIRPEVPEAEEGATRTPEEAAEAERKADEEARATAEAVLQRVTVGGEDFAAVAEEMSDDATSAEEGGDLDWHPRGDLVPEFEEAAFSLKPGQVYTDVVRSQFGYHIIKLEEYDPERPLSEFALQARKSRVLEEWLAEERQKAEIERLLSPSQIPSLPTPQFGLPLPRP